MDCDVQLPPELGLDPQAFTDVWNSLPRCRNNAEARTVSPAADSDKRDTTVLALLERRTQLEDLLPLLHTVLKQLGVEDQVMVEPVSRGDGSTVLAITTVQRQA